MTVFTATVQLFSNKPCIKTIAEIIKRNLSSSNGPTWNWVPPKNKEANDRSDDEVIPVIERKLLTKDEIKLALERLGAEDITIMPLIPPLDTLKTMIIATGNSVRHLRKISDAIVKALKSRNLTMASGIKGAEGEKDDDWLYIDCYDIAVHLILSNTRKILNLEQHWSPDNKRPFLNNNLDEKEYDKQFDLLLEKYPVPSEYNVDKDDDIPQKIDPKNVTKL